jgi:hypothetical protein
MKVKYTTRDVRAGTTYVELDKDQHLEIQGYMFQWITHLNENVRDPKQDLGCFFEPQNELPRMGRGKQNSIVSYIAGILNNQLFYPNAKTGRYQQDFTLDNIQWIQQISHGLADICGTPCIEFTESVWA